MVDVAAVVMVTRVVEVEDTVDLIRHGSATICWPLEIVAGGGSRVVAPSRIGSKLAVVSISRWCHQRHEHQHRRQDRYGECEQFAALHQVLLCISTVYFDQHATSHLFGRKQPHTTASGEEVIHSVHEFAARNGLVIRCRVARARWPHPRLVAEVEFALPAAHGAKAASAYSGLMQVNPGLLPGVQLGEALAVGIDRGDRALGFGEPEVQVGEMASDMMGEPGGERRKLG